jgi:bacillopeptidase F
MTRHPRASLVALATTALLLAACLAVVTGTHAAGPAARPSGPAWPDAGPTTLPPAAARRIAPALLKQLLDGTPGQQVRFVVELQEQANLSALPPGIGRRERGGQVMSLLQATASRSQADLLAFLQAQQAAGHVLHFRSLWVFNALAVQADAAIVWAIASRPEVHILREDRWRQWLAPVSFEQTPSDAAPNTLVQWNIARIRADQAWSALGLDGTGITVAIMDTGADWQHPALLGQYRGYKPGGLVIHEGNWICTTDEGYLYPVDGYGHGTHVTGTAVGGTDDDGVSIGVAPGARWIAAKMLDDQGYGYDSWIHSKAA